MATSAYQRGAHNHPSMLEKSLERRRVNKEHNSNFRAGHVPVHEDHLHKTGLRGRKRYFAYCFLALLYITAICNLAVTALVMWALQIDQNGLQPVHFLRDGLMQFTADASIDSVVTASGQIGGFLERDLDVTSDGGSVHLLNTGQSRVSVKVSSGETILRAKAGLEVISPRSGAPIYHTDVSKEAILPTRMTSMKTNMITTPMIVSPTEDNLQLESNETVELVGHKEVHLTSKEIVVNAQEVLIKSMSSLLLDSSGGIFINATLLPKADDIDANRPKASVFSLCVCKTNGQLFRVLAGSGVRSLCANVPSNFNLCDI